MEQQTAFLFYLSIPALSLGFGYYFFHFRRQNKLFGQFDELRREANRVETQEQFNDLEKRVMVWNGKLRLESEAPWRTELFGLMREKRNWLKENG
jgi:hypothetical protein